MNIKTKFCENDSTKQRLARTVLILCLVTRSTQRNTQELIIKTNDDLNLPVLKLVVWWLHTEKKNVLFLMSYNHQFEYL